MSKSKSTRAFRTISEAGDELGLQPHVLRFWESKFPQIQPMKRRGGRRFYRPEDIEFLRGIKILLHKGKASHQGCPKADTYARCPKCHGTGPFSRTGLKTQKDP